MTRSAGERSTGSGRYPPIADYALLADCHSAALVSRDGSVDWCCFHRFDARPVFGRLLDWDRGGHTRLAPAAPYRVRRRYVEDTNVLETRFETDDGVLVVTDCLAVHPGVSARDSRRSAEPYHALIRIARCEDGEVDARLEFEPRFDYGLTVPRLERHGRHVAAVYGGADALLLDSTLPVEQVGTCSAIASGRLRRGETATVSIRYYLPNELRIDPLDAEESARRMEETIEFWRDWAATCTYDGACRGAVMRSALVLKALTNAPTGAIVAAPTTSLPEHVGGHRNWDYRYTWLRDAALNLYALFELGYTGEAHDFMTWVKRTTAGRAEDLQIMYGVGGERLLHEAELDLEGYRASRPVRIGNAAFSQFQLDIYGELLDTAWLYHRHGGEIDEVFWELCRGVVDVVQERWTEPDHGIWEQRTAERHYVHSKVMAWVAVDRAIRLARALGLPADLDRWRALRRDIRERVEHEGVDAETGAFVRAFGGDGVDASNLLFPLVRFLKADDPRVRATFERVEKELTRGGLVDRFHLEDGRPRDEATFVICSFWLVDNLALAGERDRAVELFERLLDHANDVGLLSEEIDPHTGELLGNFPQAFSHVGLIGAALNLAKAVEGSRGENEPGAG